ncbi:MAG: hypothetical protein A2X32_05215 [Elusimicrobia bacterium GWC2_64_44]|nr:MAG: hypothetical protein A2X32_05215 [Elusimicrobia bacterium GWC2_64_44]
MVSWSIDATTVSATLTLPAAPGPHPAVVLVAGSGPTDRDWNSRLLPGKNGSASLLAQGLARAGFAVLRYDKRFLGPYAAGNMVALGGKLSFQTHQDEVASAADFLRRRADIAPGRLFALTNSEGALHALNAQLGGQAKFAGLVLTAPPGRTGKVLMRWQIEKQVKPLPEGAAIMAAYDKLIAKFQAGLPFAADPVVPAPINNLVASLYAGLPFSRELLLASAPALFASADRPRLVLIGKKDIQVDVRLDGKLFEDIQGEEVTVAYPENANHVLKYEPRPAAELLPAFVQQNYNAADRELDPETLKAIITWLKPLAFAKEQKGTGELK